MAALGYTDAKIFLKEDVVLTFSPEVETMLMPSIRRTQAATRASTTRSTRDQSELSARILVMSAHGEFGEHDGGGGDADD